MAFNVGIERVISGYVAPYLSTLAAPAKVTFHHSILLEGPTMEVRYKDRTYMHICEDTSFCTIKDVNGWSKSLATIVKLAKELVVQGDDDDD